MLSAMASFFMDTYSVVLDVSMIQNIFQTNTREAWSLFNFKLLLYVLILGALPSVYIYKTKLLFKPIKQELLLSLKIIAIAVVVIVSQALIFNQFYFSFSRAHKEVRVYANPLFYFYSFAKYLAPDLSLNANKVAFKGRDAQVQESDTKRELVIVVVGETARADNFSLNGYHRKTNPLLEKENVYSFNNFTSCGTSTAVSVPCMFSHLDNSNFTVNKGRSEENLLDILDHAGVSVLWRDNNSDSKGVALRVEFEDFKTKDLNPVCDPECRDIGMLADLQSYIDSQNNNDIIVVLHQMGNHGPDYYNRYPPSFEKFKPVCHNDLLDECTKEEIVNAYDNAILYTDYFLSETISLLKKNMENFETTLLYVSDHGESLGEHGVYLHGLPKFMAPSEQLKVGVILWIGDSVEDIDKTTLAGKIGNPYSHDHLFHTILGLFEINSTVYNKDFDLIDH
jgi:lipid A ethanolaminephosphotransferase